MGAERRAAGRSRSPALPPPPLPLLLLLSLLAARTSAEAGYSTVYACEGSTLNLECGQDELINLIRANFGRFSITICNQKGNTDWSVNCMSPRSLRVLEQSCGVSNTCSVEVTAEKFGDSCPGTFKYIEVHYSCVSAASTTTTKRPHPPWYSSYPDPNLWLTSGTSTSRRPPAAAAPVTTTQRPRLPGRPAGDAADDGVQVVIPGVTGRRQQAEQDSRDQQPAPASSSTTSTTTSTTTTTTTEATTTTTVTTTTSTTTRRPVQESPIEPEQQQPAAPSEAPPAAGLPDPWLASSAHHCGARASRGLRWNYTRAGEVAVEPCPGGATGEARWHCLHGAPPAGRAVWAPRPDLSECKSVQMAALEERLLSGELTLRVAAELAQVTDRTDSLLGGDVRTAARLVNHLASRQAQQLLSVPDVERREALVTELMEHVVRAASQLLDPGQVPAWRDLGLDERRRAATSLLIGLEQNAFLLADSVLPDRTIQEIDTNLLMTVVSKRLESRDADPLVFPSSEARRQWDAEGSSLRLPATALRDNSRDRTVQVVFLAYRGLESVLEPLSWQQRRPQARGLNGSRVVNSLVLSASLGEGRHIQLSDPVELTFRHLVTEGVSNPTCSFWDYTINMWSEEGCRVTFTNVTHTFCECDHLTSFAVLADVSSAPWEDAEQPLRIVVYVGCAVALLCLSATLIALLLVRGLQSERTAIHKNLLLCLLVVELSFLAGLHQTASPVVCGVLAGLMHFSLMSAFFWVFLEAFQLYVTLTVFEPERSRLRWYYVAAYGVPLLVVAVSCVVDPVSYGTPLHCWLRTDNYFVFSFAGPAIILILLTAIFLGLAVWVMMQHSSAAITIKTKEQSRLSYIRGWLRAALMLLLLLVLCWTFGLVFLDRHDVVMAYLFTVFNALLGIFIFALHCLQNEQIPRLWSPHAPAHPKSATLTSLTAGGPAAGGGGAGGSLRRGTMRSSMPAKLRTNLAGEMLTVEKGGYNFQSHDSGHGTGSEHESPHLTLNNVRYLASAPSLERPPAAVLVPVQPGQLGPRVNPEFFAVYQQQQSGRRGGGSRVSRSHSPYHTYMDVDGEPVYEEIERHEPRRHLLLADLSDEERRGGVGVGLGPDVTAGRHHPGGGGGAHRPLMGACAGPPLSEARLRDFDQAQLYHDLRRLHGYGEAVAMAVLSGDGQVVSALHPQQQQAAAAAAAAAAAGATLPVDRARSSHSRFAEC